MHKAHLAVMENATHTSVGGGHSSLSILGSWPTLLQGHSVLSRRSWQLEEDPDDWRKKKRQKGESEKGAAGQPHSSAWENYEASPEGLCFHVMENRNSQHVFSKHKMCRTSLSLL